MRVNQYFPDMIGALTLAALAALVAWLIEAVYGPADAYWAVGIGYPILLISSLLAWHSAKWPKDADDLFRYGCVSVPVGAISLTIDAMIGTFNYPQLPLREAIWRAGSPFGIPLTIAICPGFTLVALAGAARAYFATNK